MAEEYQATDLLGDVLELVEQRWVSADAIMTILENSHITKTSSQILFLQELKKLIRAIPTEAFNDTEQRQNLIETTQEALDRVIDKEEDEFLG